MDGGCSRGKSLTAPKKFAIPLELSQHSCGHAMKLWLWKNGDHYLAFDNAYPCQPDGDPMTLGEPAAIAFLRPSVPRDRSSECRAAPPLLK
jgi:hypothetical protein